MFGTWSLKFRTFVSIVLISTVHVAKVTAVEPVWTGKSKIAGESTGIIRGLESVNGRLFIGAENGFFELTGRHAKHFTSANSPLGIGYISKLHKDTNNRLWISEYGHGVFQYDFRKSEFTELELPERIAKYAWSVTTNDEIIAVAAIYRIAIVNKVTKEAVVIENLVSGEKLAGVYIVDTLQDEIVVAERNNVLFVDHSGNVSRTIPREEHLPFLKRITYVKVVNEDIYIGGIGGIYKLSESESIFYPLDHPDGSKQEVESIFISNSGELWVGAGGFYRLDHVSKRLIEPQIAKPKYGFDQIREVQQIHQLQTGELIIASTQLGLTSINPADLAMDYVHETDFPFRKDIYAIAPVGDERYLAKTADNWHVLEGESGKLSALSSGAFDAEPIPLVSGELFDPASCAVYQFENNHFQLRKKLLDPNQYCPNIHPLSFTLNNQTYFYFQKESHAGFISIQNGTFALFTNAPKNIKLATLNTDGSLVLMDKSNALFVSDSIGVWIKHDIDALKGLFVYCLYEDSRTNQMYLCTSGTGLKQFSLTDKTLAEAFPNSGIPRFIRDGHIDKDGNHWLATNKGLMLVNQHFAFEFDSSDGVIDTDFNYRGILPIGNTKILLVGDQLSYVIDTVQMIEYVEKRRSHLAYAQVVDLQTRTRLGKLATLDSSAKDVAFDKAPEEITFAFASADFHYAHLQHLEYRLSGFHNEWSALPTNYGTITYSGLPYGEFKLEIRVVDKKSAAEQPITSFSLNIAKPIWLTWQAICCYVVLAALLVIGLVYLVKQYAEEKSRVLAEIIRQKQSALREMNVSMSELLAKKDRLFRNLAHELRTPVMLMMEPLLELKQKARTNEEANTLDSLYQHTSRIRSIVDQFAEVERVDSITQHELAVYDVGKSVQYVIESLRPKATAKQQVLSFENKIKHPLLLVEDSLEKITHQLIENAIAFTQEGGFIKVVVSESENQMHLSVTDNGVGLTPEEQRVLTERFGEGANNRGLPHMGIGLNLVNELVLANYGWLEIHSEPSVGTTCTIHIPIKRTQAPDETAEHTEAMDEINHDAETGEAKQVTEPESEYQSNKLPLILVVDDNEPSATYITGMLSDTFKCYDVHSAEQALAMLGVLKPDLILSDLKMPGMNGIELTRAVRALPEFEDTPIILLTAETDKAMQIESFKATANDYLTKPIEREELVLRLQNQLAISALGQQQAAEPKDGFAEIQSDYVKSIIPESATDKDRAFILKLLTVVEQNYQKENFSRKEAASALAMSERQLNRTMAKLMPDNFTLFLKRYRLEKCLPMLANGLQITQIALEVGFGSPGYFSRCFKAEYGCLPTQMEFTQHGVKLKGDES